MHYFNLLQIQHFVIYLFPALAAILVFAVGLGFSHIRRKNAKEREQKVIREYPLGIQSRNAPMPMVLILTIAGTVIWALAYILLIGLFGVKI